MKKDILKAVGLVTALLGLCSVPFIIDKKLDAALDIHDEEEKEKEE